MTRFPQGVDVKTLKVNGDLAAGNIVAVGRYTTSGGSATESTPVQGLDSVTSNDVVLAQLSAEGSSPVTLDAAVVNPGTGMIDFTFSADPSTDHELTYIVVRILA